MNLNWRVVIRSGKRGPGRSSATLLPPTVVTRIELKIGCRWRAWTRTLGQNERWLRPIIKIECVEQIIRLFIAFGKPVEIKAILNKLQY